VDDADDTNDACQQANAALLTNADSKWFIESILEIRGKV